jgi:hypothetical protein
MPMTPAPEPAAPRRVGVLQTDGTRLPKPGAAVAEPKETDMNSIIYIVGLVVVVLAILSFVGLA